MRSEGSNNISPIIVARRVRIALILEALWMLLKSDVLATFGYSTLCQQMNLGVAGNADPNAENTIAEVAIAVHRASRCYPRSPACLQRSVALASMLRKRGIAADLKIGVQQIPFASHAWVEVAGRIINDVQRVRDAYPPLHEFKAMPGKPRR